MVTCRQAAMRIALERLLLLEPLADQGQHPHLLLAHSMRARPCSARPMSFTSQSTVPPSFARLVLTGIAAAAGSALQDTARRSGTPPPPPAGRQHLLVLSSVPATS